MNADEGTQYALEVENLSKIFGGLAAVDGVNLRVRPGERRAIIGPNGAGKTTLFNLISGELRVTTGRVILFGEDITRYSPHERVSRGLCRTYQITNIFAGLTVEENVLLAAQGLSRRKYSLFGTIPNHGEFRERVRRTLDNLGLGAIKDVIADELSHGEKRQLELALAMVGNPKVLLLDEPAAGLATKERAMMAEIIRGLPRDLTLILIEHDMDLALGLVDWVTCLHTGRVLVEDDPKRIRENPVVQEVYLGAGWKRVVHA